MTIKYLPCEYCGNKSHKVNKRGQCLGCGAPREEMEESVLPVLSEEPELPSFYTPGRDYATT